MLSEDTRLLILRLVERCRDDGPAMAAVVEHLMGRDAEEPGGGVAAVAAPPPDTVLLDFLIAKKADLVERNGKWSVINRGWELTDFSDARDAIEAAMKYHA